MIKLHHGDCLEIMKSIPNASIDAIITDPPYGTTACKWDSVIPFEPMWKGLNRVIKDNGAIVLFGSQPFTSALIMSNPKMFKYELIWEKTRPTGFFTAKIMPMKIHENIIVFSKHKNNYYPIMTKADESKIDKRKTFNPTVSHYLGGIQKERVKDSGFRYPTSIKKVPSISKKNQHPTEKPIELMEYLVKTYTQENDTVLDFTMGSGTTGVACQNLNRNFIGIELDETYFNIAKERIQIKTTMEIK